MLNVFVSALKGIVARGGMAGPMTEGRIERLENGAEGNVSS